MKAAITPLAPKPQPQPQPQENNSGTNDDSQLSLFSRQILEAHNIKRASHGVNPLTWSNELYNYANKVASSMIVQAIASHTSGPYGEKFGFGIFLRLMLLVLGILKDLILAVPES